MVNLNFDETAVKLVSQESGNLPYLAIILRDPTLAFFGGLRIMVKIYYIYLLGPSS